MDSSLFSWRKKRPIAGKRSYQLLAALDCGPRKYKHFASYLQQDAVRGRVRVARSAKAWIKLLALGLAVFMVLWAVFWWIQESLAAYSLLKAV
ncbi:MAG: hypothetical protein ACPGF8_02600 [Opitutales bacterium]